jgi:hypothetical protein
LGAKGEGTASGWRFFRAVLIMSDGRSGMPEFTLRGRLLRIDASFLASACEKLSKGLPYGLYPSPPVGTHRGGASGAKIK